MFEKPDFNPADPVVQDWGWALRTGSKLEPLEAWNRPGSVESFGLKKEDAAAECSIRRFDEASPSTRTRTEGP